MYKYSSCTNKINIIGTFRELWEQHVMWTRSFLMSTILGLGDLQFVTTRLLRNPSDFANILKIYYGKDNALKFQKLFEEHLMIAASLVNNAKNGNIAAADADERKWYQNANDISAFLSGLNAYWPRQEWQNMLYSHLQMTKEEAVDFMTGQFQSATDIYERIEDEALNMADFMSQGITKQFNI